MARKRKPRRRTVYSWTFGFPDGAVIGVAPERKPTDKRIKEEGWSIDDDGVYRETLYDSDYWKTWEPEKRYKAVELLANRLNTRRAIRELILPELKSLHESIDSLRKQLDRIEDAITRNGR